jgi:hypothetical protein
MCVVREIANGASTRVPGLGVATVILRCNIFASYRVCGRGCDWTLECTKTNARGRSGLSDGVEDKLG